MLGWISGKARLWKVARRLRQDIRSARPGKGRASRRSTPRFGELLAEAIRLQEAGLDYVVNVTPERRGPAGWENRPEQVRLDPFHTK